jgi:integrase
MARRKHTRRAFGSVRRLPSGRYQARYLGPDGRTYTARTDDGRALTFDTSSAAGAFLARVSTDIQRGLWVSPDAPKPGAPKALREYAGPWLATRQTPRGEPLADLTRELYQGLLDSFILPAFGDTPLTAITKADVRNWYAGLTGAKGKPLGPTRRAHAYSLLRTIMGTAADDDVIAVNPCAIRGAGQSKRARKIRPASLAELETLVKALPERYRLMALLAAWCALRFGELAELRRGDVDVKAGVIRVRRGVVRPKGAKGQRAVKGPKSEAGERDVAIPPHLIPAVRDHLREHVAASQAALLFPAARDPGRQMAPGTLYAVYCPAREAAGRPDLRFHDLRHTGATLAAVSGATLKELMSRLGHSTPSAAMIYQHAAADRDKVIAEALSKLAAGTVTPISSAKGRARRASAG